MESDSPDPRLNEIGSATCPRIHVRHRHFRSVPFLGHSSSNQNVTRVNTRPPGLYSSVALFQTHDATLHCSRWIQEHEISVPCCTEGTQGNQQDATREGETRTRRHGRQRRLSCPFLII